MMKILQVPLVVSAMDSDKSTDDKENVIISDENGGSDSDGASGSAGDGINFAGRRKVLTGPQGVTEVMDIS
jgi:hypothetical protein